MEQPGVNPFHYGRPIADPAGFFGRERELRQLGSHLSQLHWVSVVGPRRIGKTSLLWQLCHPHVAARLGLRAAEYTLVLVECSGLGGLDAEGWRSLLVGRAAEALGVSPAPEVRNGFVFRETLRRLLAGGRKLVLMLDEFEALASNPHLDADFFLGLRALSSGYPVALVTASRLPLIELTYQDTSVLASPFFNPFVTQRLGLLEEVAARALLGQPGAGFAPETVEFLLELTGPHPCFLQIAGYHGFERKREGPLDEAARAELRRAVEKEVEPHLVFAWRQLSPPARYALVSLPLVRSGEAGLEELREACLVREVGYLSPLVERFARRQALPDVLQVGDLWVDLRRQRAVWRRQPLPLSDLAYRLLCYFLAHPGQPIPWLRLEVEVWGELEKLPAKYAGNPERVDAGVDRVRRALREVGAVDPISFRGGSYTFDSGLLVSGQ